MRRAFYPLVLLLLVGLAGSCLLPTGGAAAVPTVTLESQAWWRSAGIVVPSAVGEHIHVKATVPVDGAIIDGPVEIPVTVTLHDATGRTNWLRVSDGSTVKQSWTVAIGPCTDCTWSGTVTVDFSKWGTGRREMRWSANVPAWDTNGDGVKEANRQFQSSGWQICVRSCSPTYRSGPFTEARGWYDAGHEYANARLVSPIANVRSGGTISVKLVPGSDGDPTKLAGVYIDPDFHHGSAGIVVKQVAGPFSGSVTLPTLPPGPHRLVLLSSDGQNAGVQVVFFTVT